MVVVNALFFNHKDLSLLLFSAALVDASNNSSNIPRSLLPPCGELRVIIQSQLNHKVADYVKTKRQGVLWH